jgi:hypothetical protein
MLALRSGAAHWTLLAGEGQVRLTSKMTRLVNIDDGLPAQRAYACRRDAILVWSSPCALDAGAPPIDLFATLPTAPMAHPERPVWGRQIEDSYARIQSEAVVQLGLTAGGNAAIAVIRAGDASVGCRLGAGHSR